jgi:hypothetical protein
MQILTELWKLLQNIKISANESLGYFEFKTHKSWFDERCSKLLDQRQHAKLQWLNNPSQKNRDNLNRIGREASRHFRNKNEGIRERQN